MNKKLSIKENTIIKCILTALTTAVLCMALLFLTGMIPQSAIKDNCAESAQYFMEEELFGEVIDKQFNTIQDNYADCILINVMYHISGENTFSSLIKASYYDPDFEQVNVSFYDSVQEDKEPNVDYFRYWHGSMVLLRPLFTLTGIEGARMVLGIALFVMIAVASALLWRLKAKAAAVLYLLGNTIVQVWMCLFCIEYITTFLVANVILIVELCLFAKAKKEKSKTEEHLRKQVLTLMAVSGVVTCFVDFLTTETLTVTIPLMFLMILLHEEGKLKTIKEEVKYLFKCGITWGFSYAGMFVLKWGLSALVLGGKAFTEAMAAAGERIGGTVYMGNTNLDPEADFVQRFIGLIHRNQGCLFPFKENMNMGTVLWLFLGVCMLCFAIVYLFRPRKLPFNIIVVCLLLSALPYLRYMTLQNHSYQHYFFTYRAQLVTLVAIGYCTWQFGLKGLFLRSKSKK